MRTGASLAEIAKREGMSTTYATRVMPLAFLAPDIVSAIHEGRQPLGLSEDQAKAIMPSHYTGWVKADHMSYKMIEDAGIAVGRIKPKS